MIRFDVPDRQLVITEPCGLDFEPQAVKTVFPPELLTEREFHLCEKSTGRCFPAQRSSVEPDAVFVLLELKADETMRLTVVPGQLPVAAPVTLERTAEVITLGNDRLTIRLAPAKKERNYYFGPVAGIAGQDGFVFGKTYFDTFAALQSDRFEILEAGPVRCAVRYHADFADGGFYEADLTLDAGQTFVRWDERFQNVETDQLVWLFENDARPRQGYFLDSSAGYQTISLDDVMDDIKASLGAWSQMSQLYLSDGFAMRLPGKEVCFGAVTLDGGSWRGNNLNSMDAAVRRFRNHDLRSRRLTPAAAKADQIGTPGREQNFERDRSGCTAAVTWEGWIGNGRRSWALVIADYADLRPPAGDDLTDDTPPLGHFEETPDKARFAAKQSLLRKIHIRRGMLALEDIIDKQFTAAAIPSDRWGFTLDDPFGKVLLDAQNLDIDSGTVRRRMIDFIRCRVFSFWYGAGAASTNPVSSRRVGPYMFLLERYCEKGLLDAATCAELRAKLLFLSYLMASSNYYCGPQNMLPAGHLDSFEPAMRGMANQNFFTDVYCLAGTAGALYLDHPESALRRRFFIDSLKRQLDYHVYQSGVWEESHTYFQHVLLTLFSNLVIYRKLGFFNFFRYEPLVKLFLAIPDQLTPPDKNLENCRHFVAFGDHEANLYPYRPMWQAYADAFAPDNPDLADMLRHLLTATDIRPSRLVDGLGVFFRAPAADGSETMFALRSGAAWGHHHNDDSSIWLFSANRMLIGDAGFGGRDSGRAKIADFGHSRWTVPNMEVINYMWRFNRGWVYDCQLDGALPFASCFTPMYIIQNQAAKARVGLLERPLRHYRSVVMLSGNAFLVIDSNRERTDAWYRFHLGSRQLSAAGDRVTADYGDGVRLTLQTLTPAAMTVLPPVSGSRERDNEWTSEVIFEVKNSNDFAVFLIYFGEIAPPEVTFDRSGNGGIRVQYQQRAVALTHQIDG